jgi:hypothetical protein
MKHLTLGALKRIIADLGDAPDDVEVRFFLRKQDDYWDDSFGQLTATIDSPAEEDVAPRYLGLAILDTGDMS